MWKENLLNMIWDICNSHSYYIFIHFSHSHIYNMGMRNPTGTILIKDNWFMTHKLLIYFCLLLYSTGPQDSQSYSLFKTKMSQLFEKLREKKFHDQPQLKWDKIISSRSIAAKQTIAYQIYHSMVQLIHKCNKLYKSNHYLKCKFNSYLSWY